MGSMKKERVKVVDNGIEIKDWSNWFDSNIKEVYSKMQLTKINNKSFMATTLNTANELASSKPIQTYNYNMLYKGASEYYFYNHVMKPLPEDLSAGASSWWMTGTTTWVLDW